MNIGIIGSGNMGRAIGVRLAQSGYEVFFGGRDERKAKEAAKLAGSSSQSGHIDDAARFGQVLIWTMRENDVTKVLQDVSLLNGKIVIDLNNRDFANEVHNGAWFQTSIAEELQERLAEANVVKAFNTIAMETLDTKPDELRAAGAQIFLAGNNNDSKKTVAGIAGDLGFEAVDLGNGPAAFRAAEALGDVIRLLMIDGKRGSRAHFRLIELPEPTLGAIGKRGDSSYA